MAGQHRDNSLSWRMPSAVGIVAVLALVLTVWLTGLSRLGDSEDTSLAIAAPSTTTTTSSQNPTPSTSTTTTTPAPSTTTTPNTTTQPPTSTETTPTSTTTTEPPTSTTPARQACSSALAGTRPYVAEVGNHIKQRFGVDEVGGRAGRSGGGDHPTGLALDFMVGTSTGDNLAAYVLAHQDEFGVQYVIWRQRINMGNGWETMEDRGSPTANHYDHVHVSFTEGTDVSVTC